MIGQTISHYKILEKLGEGGMGVVYKAQDTKLDRVVALKFLPEHLSASETETSRFLQEARAAAALNHPNICTIHGIEESGGQVFIVMEYVDGETLRARLRAGSLPLDTVMSYATQLAEALQEAHTKHIVHRDIKPDNIMVNAQGRIKAMDFGLAKLKGGVGLTRSHSTLGTTAYMSPEQLRSADVDHRTDIWSFGVVLYEMLTGRLPFRGEHHAAMVYSITNEEPQPFEQFRSDVPALVKKVVFRAMEKSPERRHKTIEEVLKDLESLKPTQSPTTVLVRRPQTKYAKSGNVNIAYQVVGSGSVDLVYVMGWVSNIDYFWEEPSYARFLNRLASFSRLILFDKRGTGLSDRVQESELPTLEQRMDDVRAVMDAVGSERAAVFGVSEGGPMSALFAATYPERTVALIMYGSYAKRIWAPDYPWAPTPEERQKFFDAIVQGWGGVVDIATLAPSVINDRQFKEWWAAYLRRSASPGAALALAKMNTHIDIRHLLPTIKVPTLIIHRTGDMDIDVGGSRYMATRIQGAGFVELPGNDHLPWVGDQEALLQEVEGFLSTIRYRDELNTVLATVLNVQIESAASTARELHSVIKRQTERFKGREVGLEESGYVAAFDGPVRAIRAALAIKSVLHKQGVEIKAGLHTGECEVEGATMRGLAMRVGSQVSAKANAGEILASRTVRDLVAGSGMRFWERGTYVFHGLEGEIQVFAVEDDAPEITIKPNQDDIGRAEDSKIPAKRLKPAWVVGLLMAVILIALALFIPFKTDTASRRSIAVLPMKNLSDDKEDEYFSDGMTEDIIAQISKIPDVKVISRTTITRYKGTDKSLRSIGKELDVATILEGSVRRSGNHVRVVAQLIDATSDEHLWTETYDKELTEIFSIQSDVAKQIASALRVKLALSGDERTRKQLTQNFEAYDYYLRGKFHFNRSNRAGVDSSIKLFQKALELDPSFALAYANLAQAYHEWYSTYDARKEWDEKAFVAVEKALALDPELAEAYLVRGIINWGQFSRTQPERGLKELRRAIELNPNLSGAHEYLGAIYGHIGLLDEALVEAKKSVELDPGNVEHQYRVGQVLLYQQQYAEALSVFENVREVYNPGFLSSQKGITLWYLGRKEEAWHLLKNALALYPEDRFLNSTFAVILAARGEEQEAEARIRIALEKGKGFGDFHHVAYYAGTVYALLKKNQQAVQWLQTAADKGFPCYPLYERDPNLNSLRNDPAFLAFMEKLKERWEKYKAIL